MERREAEQSVPARNRALKKGATGAPFRELLVGLCAAINA
jgi:hypothetical protein